MRMTKMSMDVEANQGKTAEELVAFAGLKMKDKNFKAAAKLYEQAVDLDPDNLDLRLHLAVCVGKEDGDLNKTIEILSGILDIDANHALALDNLGRALSLIGSKAGAKGWFQPFEAGHLYRTIKAIDDPAPVIVELGSCFGLSSMIIAMALVDKPRAKIYCVDAWEGDGSSVTGLTREFIKDSAVHGDDFFGMFESNMRNAGVWHNLTPIQGYTTEVVKTWNKQADLIFIDADHSYEGVRSDVRDWKDFVKIGGQILMHDVELELAGSEKDSGPGLVVHEFLGLNSNYAPGTLVSTLYLARRQS
jgi:tetratricopeptide (TPR) repeat protein